MMTMLWTTVGSFASVEQNSLWLDLKKLNSVQRAIDRRVY